MLIIKFRFDTLYTRKWMYMFDRFEPKHTLMHEHLVTEAGNTQKARPSHLTTVDTTFKVSPKDSAFVGRKGRVLEGCSPWIWTQP